MPRKLRPTIERVHRRHEKIQSLKERADSNRTPFDVLADFLTSAFGTVWFLVVNAVVFFVWILLNSGLIPGLATVDPYPFGFLTMAVSLEAIFLAIIVLISQNRQARIAELREELALYIDTYAESEITKVMYLLTLLLEKNGIDISKDEELQAMLKDLESEHIEHELEKRLAKG